MVELVEVAVLKGELILGAAEPTPDVDVLGRLHEQRDAFDLRQLRPQPVDDLAGARVALIARLEIDEHPAVIDGLVDAAGSDRRDDAVDARVLQQDVDEPGLTLDHCHIRDVLGGFRDRDDEAGILLRKGIGAAGHDQNERGSDEPECCAFHAMAPRCRPTLPESRLRNRASQPRK